MKKTLTVNLNSIVFHIDDDAYEILRNYLADVEKHLSEDEKREVMADIEARIAELFTELLQRNKNVITIDDVMDIINILGNPNQYSEEDEEEEKTASPKTDKKKSRHFYRDPDNAILGGVASGIAAYFGWDVTWVRIILVILTLASAGNMVLIYLLVWIIAPRANTASQRLEMQGEDVTVESIKG
jgi:phage shock protein PspC (stress-responsive transcriptional regulator)